MISEIELGQYDNKTNTFCMTDFQMKKKKLNSTCVKLLVK